MKNFLGSLGLFVGVSIVAYFVLGEARPLWVEIGMGLFYGLASLPLLACFLEIYWWWQEVPTYVFDQTGVRKRYSRKKMILWKYENIIKVSAFKNDSKWYQPQDYIPFDKMLVFFRFPSKETENRDEKLFIFESDIKEKLEDIIPKLLEIPGLREKALNNLQIEEVDQNRLYDLFRL